MRRSTILSSCARFIMLSLSGERQISGKRVRMSIFMVDRVLRTRCQKYAASPPLIPTRSENAFHLLDDFERSALAVTRPGTVHHRTNLGNGLPVAPDDAPDVALAQRHFKNRHFAARDFRDHH